MVRSRRGIIGKVAEQQEQQATATEQEIAERQQWLRDKGVQMMESRISISTPEQLTNDQHNNLVPSYVDYQRLQWYAETSVRSHRLEQLAAYALRELGLDARVVPVTIDGKTDENKRADITVLYKGHELAIEVKENRRASLGLPLDESNRLGLQGYKRYPKQLWCDSVAAYNAKFNYHLSQGQLLAGVIVMCSIAELSDEDDICYGLLWLHGDVSLWNKRTCHNPAKGTTYAAYEARGEQIQPLCSVISSLDAAVDYLESR